MWVSMLDLGDLLLAQDTIFQLTHNAVQKDEEDVAKQAIEFWCSICEEEAAIQEARCRDPLGFLAA